MYMFLASIIKYVLILSHTFYVLVSYCTHFYTFMEVVSMMNVKIPSSNFRDAHVMSTELCCLYIPNNVLAVIVLIANLNHSSCYTINTLPVNIKPIPGISEFDDWISFKGLLKKNALNGDSKMDEFE